MSLIFESSFLHHDKFIVLTGSKLLRPAPLQSVIQHDKLSILAGTNDSVTEHNIQSSGISNWNHICFTERDEYIILLSGYVFLIWPRHGFQRQQDLLLINNHVYQPPMTDYNRRECKDNSPKTQQSFAW